MAAETASPAAIETDVLSDFFAGMMQLAGDAQRRLTGKQSVRGGSRALAMAVEAGLDPKLTYTVGQTAIYSGIDRQALYREIDAGRLRAVVPAGCERGMRVSVDDFDRWMEESTR